MCNDTQIMDVLFSFIGAGLGSNDEQTKLQKEQLNLFTNIKN